MALLDFLFEGKAPPVVETQQQTNMQLPPFAQQYLQGLMGRANAIASQGYSSYEGPRIAEAAPMQQNAWNMVQQNAGSATPTFNNANSMIQQSGVPFNQQVFDQYKSPYINDVVNRIGTLGMRNFNENMMPALNDKFIGSGQFRSDRNADMTSRLARDTQESILGQQATALQQAQDNAMSNYNQGMARQQSAGTALGNLASTQDQTQLRDAAALEASGQAQRGINQQNLDLAYQNFSDQRDWGKNQVGFMNSAIRGTPLPGSSTTTTGQSFAPVVGASPLAQIAGGIGAVSSLFGKAKGGRVSMDEAKAILAQRMKQQGALQRMRQYG